VKIVLDKGEGVA